MKVITLFSHYMSNSVYHNIIYIFWYYNSNVTPFFNIEPSLYHFFILLNNCFEVSFLILCFEICKTRTYSKFYCKFWLFLYYFIHKIVKLMMRRTKSLYEKDSEKTRRHWLSVLMLWKLMLKYLEESQQIKYNCLKYVKEEKCCVSRSFSGICESLNWVYLKIPTAKIPSD